LWTIVFSPSGCPVPPQKNIGIGELASGSLTIKKRLKFREFGARLSFDYKPISPPNDRQLLMGLTT